MMMSNPFEVVVQVENRGEIPVYLKENFLYALPGRHGLVIRVDPFSTKVMAAHTFFACNKSFGRPSTVEVHINGKLVQRLTPQTFVHYPKIIVDGFTDEEGSTIRVVRPQRALELSRLRAFNFLAMEFKERGGVACVEVIGLSQMHGYCRLQLAYKLMLYFDSTKN